MTVTFVDDRRTGGLWDVSPNPYSSVVRALAEPIMKHLPQSTINRYPVTGTLNVRFMTFARGHGDFFLSHGIADKNWRDAPKVKHFAYIGYSGPMWLEKYRRQGVPESKLFECGYTKLDPIFQGEYPRGITSGDRVLYAPTHSPRSRSYPTSYPKLLPVIERLRDHFDIVIAPHPKDREDFALTMQEMVDADVVIADAGSTVYEAWALGKPVIFPDWLIRDNIDRRWPNSFEQRIYHEQIGYHAQDEAEMRKQIKTAIFLGISDREVEFMRGILPVELRGRSGERTAEVLSGIVQVRRRAFVARAAEMEKVDIMAGKPNVILRANTDFHSNGIMYRRGNKIEATATEAKELVRRKLASEVDDGDDGEDLSQETTEAPRKDGPDIRTNPVGTDRETMHIETPSGRRRLVGDEDGSDVTTQEVVESTRRGSRQSRDLSEEAAHEQELTGQREGSADDGSNTNRGSGRGSASST